MRLSSFRVNGLFGTYNHSISLNGEGLTYVHSVNGVGKSTMLSLMCDIFTGNAAGVESAIFDSAEAVFDDGTVVSVGRHGVCTVNGKESSLKDIDEMYDALYLSTDRNTMKEKGILRPAMDVLLEEFEKKYSETKKDDEIKPGDGTEYGSMSGEEFVSLCRDLKARMDFISDIGIRPVLPGGCEFPPIRADFDDDMRKYNSLAAGVSDWVGKNYVFAESVSALLFILNDLFSDKRITISDGKLVAEIGGGRTIPMSMLSSGEKQIFIIFYRMLFHAENGSLVVIDEPELSLHVSWQQKLGEIFLEMHRIRGLDVLASTHSPLVIHDRWDLSQELRLENA